MGAKGTNSACRLRPGKPWGKQTRAAKRAEGETKRMEEVFRGRWEEEAAAVHAKSWPGRGYGRVEGVFFRQLRI